MPERASRKCSTCLLAGGLAREQIARWIDDAIKSGTAITAPRIHQLLSDWCSRHGLPKPAVRNTFVRHVYECERERWRALKAL